MKKKKIQLLLILLVLIFLPNLLHAQFIPDSLIMHKITFKDVVEIYEKFLLEKGFYDEEGNYNPLPEVMHKKLNPDENIFTRKFQTSDGYEIVIKMVINCYFNSCKTKVSYCYDIKKLGDSHVWKRASASRMVSVCDSAAFTEKKIKPDFWSFHSSRPNREWFEIKENNIVNYSYKDFDGWNFGKALIEAEKRSRN
ncbi:MAG: hypothetical protein US50_C0018G0003 [Candidatus Nomurabacteria bacterium GW2011_GWB1_37_5]|uniref:Uncharacterized protein n=1 Tax=Candidatus Nomurabacteria bacterium GW2011_GWB1_37_5 TaxID=1618742 RepID=A0A0G0H9V5_9BACT|nr:MAG: hypothetical protein US50_C0018G0003 [Candidatus Nomurabacteria bacterium GW2011_GWB1_37_5]